MIHKNIFLLIGGNLGDRMMNLLESETMIEREAGSIIKRSSIYETAAWGKTDQPAYLNRVLEIETQLSPEELLNVCLGIERKLGRLRHEKWEARTIDIDIIYFNDKIIEADKLILPHPRIAERRFVLTPLTEISPVFLHPILKKTNEQLLLECPDVLAVEIFKG